MKLRNKKTGEIMYLLFNSYPVSGDIVLEYMDENAKSGYSEYCRYDSIAKLCEEWEDYKEPLIKDEKIRKAVRTWAEASGITKVLSYGDIFWLGFRSINTESVWKFECSYSDASEFELDKEYTIAELCGEEEEC